MYYKPIVWDYSTGLSYDYDLTNPFAAKDKGIFASVHIYTSVRNL